jgi:hydroxyethylthiazole kinase-like uncharacterized protein yjeF
MRIVTAEEMRFLDDRTIREIGIPGIVLMENAGRAVAEKAAELLGSVKNKRVYVFAGKGNNGGDGFVCARYLHNWGARVKIFLIEPLDRLQGDSRVNGEIALKLGIQMGLLTERREGKKLRYSLPFADLLIDGLLGTGISKPVEGLVAEMIQLINEAGKPTIAVDLPSGIDANTGQVLGEAVQATHTVTLALPKRGIVVYPGKEYAGQVTVADISIPIGTIEEQSKGVNLITEETVAEILPHRVADSYKGDYGRAFILAGSPGMTGAAYLCSQSCLITGTGLVTLGIPAELNGLMESKTTEVMTKPLPQSAEGLFSKACLPILGELLTGIDVLAIGPGLGRSDELTEIVWELIKQSPVPLILDADGLYALSEGIEILLEAKSPAILTPHLGELSRLTGLTVTELKKDPIGYCQKIAQDLGVYLVMKGSVTMIGNPEGQVWVNTTGNSGMATGGTGDVLTGVIAGLLAQGLEPGQACIAGVYLHGLAGDLAAQEKGAVPLIAGDIIHSLPSAWRKLMCLED